MAGVAREPPTQEAITVRQKPTSHQPDPLAPLRGTLPPGWECWAGLAGLLYARRRRTSPPVVLRDVTTGGLARQVITWEHQRTHQPTGQLLTGQPLPTPDDLTQLRQQFPGWRFGAVWATAASGPDKRRLWASHDGTLLSAWDAAALAADIRQQTRH